MAPAGVSHCGSSSPAFPSMHCLTAIPGATQSALWTRAQLAKGSLPVPLLSQNDCPRGPPSQGQQYLQTWPEAPAWCPISLGRPNLGFALGMNEVARGSWKDQMGILRGLQRAPWKPVPGSCIHCVWSQALGKSDNRGKLEGENGQTASPRAPRSLCP